MELMVTVSIMAVVATLLFPALSTLNRKASVSKCLSNQRQITTAYLAWLGDNNGMLWYRYPDKTWSDGSGALFGPQDYPKAPGYLCFLLESQGLPRAKWDSWQPIANRAQTVWYCPVALRNSVITGHGATYQYYFLGKKIGATAPVTLAAVSEYVSASPYLADYFGNHDDPSQKYFSTNHNVYSYLDGHSEYR